MYWGAFFASGNRQYVDRLIQRLALCDMSRYPHKATITVFDNKGDFDSFFAGCTAAWSLSANLADGKVRQAVTEAETRAEGRQRELLHDVLTSSPNEIRVQIKAMIDPRKEHYPSHSQ
jgi:hypothetical protein